MFKYFATGGYIEDNGKNLFKTGNSAKVLYSYAVFRNYSFS